jgi:hypothetical protein
MKMADCYSPTVVQQTIPNIDMTPLERLLLSHLFDADPDGDGLYFHSWEGPSDMVCLNRAELKTALEDWGSAGNPINTWGTEQLQKIHEAENNEESDEIELDLSEIWWPTIFQEIVKRSSTLHYITVAMSFTCSKMRDDGFGGMAIFVTADVIKSQSTHEFLETCIGEVDSKDDA